jgi:hypothetical protein
MFFRVLMQVRVPVFWVLVPGIANPKCCWERIIFSIPKKHLEIINKNLSKRITSLSFMF